MLQASLHYSRPRLACKYVLINNDGVDPLAGTFTGKSEGSFIDSAQGYRFTISYIGGTGNDLELTFVERIPA